MATRSYWFLSTIRRCRGGGGQRGDYQSFTFLFLPLYACYIGALAYVHTLPQSGSHCFVSPAFPDQRYNFFYTQINAIIESDGPWPVTILHSISFHFLNNIFWQINIQVQWKYSSLKRSKIMWDDGSNPSQDTKVWKSCKVLSGQKMTFGFMEQFFEKWKLLLWWKC